MLKSLKTITSLILDTFTIGEKIKGHQDAKKKRHLAQTLHLVYIRLNDCITTGEQIIDVLEKYVSDPRQLSYGGTYELFVNGVHFDGLLSKQVENLMSLDDSLRDYSDIIRVLDADRYKRIQQFVAGKGVGVDWLAYHLSSKTIPFDSLDMEDVEHLAQFSDYMLAPKNDLSPKGQSFDEIVDAVDAFLPWYNEVSDISRRIDKHSFELDKMFDHSTTDFDAAVDPSKLEALRTLLKQNDLRKHLDDARADMKAIKEFIETSFSTVDLMIDVGSEQLKKKSFW